MYMYVSCMCVSVRYMYMYVSCMCVSVRYMYMYVSCMCVSVRYVSSAFFMKIPQCACKLQCSLRIHTHTVVHRLARIPVT